MSHSASEVTRTDSQGLKGHYRQASVLYAMKAYDHAFKAINKAVDIGPTQSQNERQYKAIQQLRATIIIQKTEADRLRAANDEAEAQRQAIARQAAKKARTNYTHLLSRDILLTITEQGMVDHPGFIFRMAGVCKSWRETLLSQPGLWNTIVLGKKGADQKVALFIKRSRGRIREVKITPQLETVLAEKIATSLAPYMPNVERLTISGQSSVSSIVFERWRYFLHSVKYLRVSQVGGGFRTDEDIIYDLLPPGSLSLRHFDISNYSCLLMDQAGSESNPAYIAYSQVETVSIRSTYIFLRKESAEEMLLSNFPAATSIELLNNRYIESSDENLPVIISELPNLRSYTNDHSTSNVFKTIRAPSLQDLSVPSLRAPSLKTFLSAPGLASCLTTLRSLDISSTSFTDTDILSALAFLPGLQFLNVSACPLSNAFLEGLARRPAGSDQENLCPNLIALSIAKNDQITGGPVTRLVRSRVPGGGAALASDSDTKEQGKSTTRTEVKKSVSSSFRPSARSAFRRPTKPPFVGKDSNQSIPATFPPNETCSVSQPPPSSLPSSSSSSTLPKIRWLNLDHCDRIDPSAISYIRKYVKFVGYSFGTPDANRIAGKGRWRWDAQWKEECDTGEGGCGLRRVAGEFVWNLGSYHCLGSNFVLICLMTGTKDQWYVNHTCEPDVVEEERSWTKGTAETMMFGSPVSP